MCAVEGRVEQHLVDGRLGDAVDAGGKALDDGAPGFDDVPGWAGWHRAR
jgi:hypothetical protein